MKMRMKEEIRNKDMSELVKSLKDARKKLGDSRIEQTQFKLKNTSLLTTLRKEIAVILTVMKEKEDLAADTQGK